MNSKKVRAGESSAEEISKAQQVSGQLFPALKLSKLRESRVPTAEEKKFHAFHSLRKARANKRLIGIREKKAKEAAEALDAPKKK